MCGNAFLEGETRTWMTKGRTVLMRKDKSKKNKASNCHSFPCLSLAWKLLREVIADEICGSLEKDEILLEERNGFRRKLKVTGDQLYIDKMFPQNIKRRKKSLAMGCLAIDYWKAYDMMLHS